MTNSMILIQLISNSNNKILKNKFLVLFRHYNSNNNNNYYYLVKVYKTQLTLNYNRVILIIQE